MGDTAELLAKIAAAMAALLAAAKAWAKLNQSNERKEDRASFKHIVDELKAEIERCKEELVFTEARRDRYRRDAHDLRNELHRLELLRQEERQELHEMLNKAHTDLTILRLQLDAERSARHHREGQEPPREEA